jgi:hypothetical protein
MTSLCALDQDREATGALLVCSWHAGKVEQAVAEAPSLWNALAIYLIRSGTSLTGMPSGSTEPGLNLDHRVVQARHDMRTNLTTWARVAYEERNLALLPPDRMESIAVYLVRQVDWFLAQPFAAQFAADMLEDHRVARSLIYPNPARRIDVGPCPEDGCTGNLSATMRPADSLLPSAVACDCSPVDDDGRQLHHWTADQWMSLGRKIRRLP